MSTLLQMTPRPLQRQVLEQQETIQRLLMAPKDEPADVTPEKPPVEPEPLATPEPRRPWWRRLWNG